MKVIFYFYYEHVTRYVVFEIKVKLDLLSNTLEVIIKKNSKYVYLALLFYSSNSKARTYYYILENEDFYKAIDFHCF